MSSVQSLYHVLFGFVHQCAGEHRSTVRMDGIRGSTNLRGGKLHVVRKKRNYLANYLVLHIQPQQQ